MFQLEVTYPTGKKGVVCQHTDNPDDVRVYLNGQDTGNYVESVFGTLRAAIDTAQIVAYELGDGHTVRPVAIQQ